MHWTRAARVGIAASAIACLLGGPRVARADQLTANETARLEQGQTVTRRTTIERGDQRYVGGVTYAIVQASSDDLAAILDDVRAYRELLPRTKRASLVGEDEGHRWVELSQGNALVTTSYTLRVAADRGGREVRFWLDPTKPHQMKDAWGFFRYEALPGGSRVLLTYGILVDFGPGIVRELFEERLTGLMLSVPELVQRYAANRVKRG